MEKEKETRRMQEAKVLLGAALGVVLVAHFLPLDGASPPAFPLYGVWAEVARTVVNLPHRGWRMDRLMEPVSIVCVAATLGAAPFLTGFLHRAVALLWVMRVLALAFSGWFCFMTLQQHRTLGSGMWLLILSFWLATAGFFRIPAAGPAMEGERR